MNLKVEYGIIAILLLASLYYFYKHQSLLSDLSRVQEEGNPELKVVKGKHTPMSHVYPGIGKEYHDLYPTEPKCRGLSMGSKRDPNQVWACDLNGIDPNGFCRSNQSPGSYCSEEDGRASVGLGACCSMRPEKENGHGGWE
jgi:hypothetical protein